MDILKIIFEHDLTLEHLSGNENSRNRQNSRESSLEEFLRPQKTYNRYYFTGTRMPGQRFGFTGLDNYSDLLSRLDKILSRTMSMISSSGNRPGTNKAERSEHTPLWHHSNGHTYDTLTSAAADLNAHDVLIGGSRPEEQYRNALVLDDHTGIRERFEPLTKLLDQNHIIIITEKAHHGLDLHLFSRNNLYESIFSEYQQVTGPDLRYFSINGKRVSSERQFYFETWTLDRPPHGFQEVTPEARLR